MAETTGKLAAKIKQAIERDGRTVYAIAKAAGIERKQLGLFMRGESDMTLTIAARLCEHLGLELREKRKSIR